MNCYGPLAGFYDRLTSDVDYRRFADRYEAAFREDGGEFHLLLDLCCGTGSMSLELSQRGYEIIAVDASEEMLMQAREKCAGLPVPPLFLHQDAAELDLYGTVDAAFCTLEGVNYLSPEKLRKLLSRLYLFIRPGGLFLFDLRSWTGIPLWMTTTVCSACGVRTSTARSTRWFTGWICSPGSAADCGAAAGKSTWSMLTPLTFLRSSSRRKDFPISPRLRKRTGYFSSAGAVPTLPEQTAQSPYRDKSPVQKNSVRGF